VGGGYSAWWIKPNTPIIKSIRRIRSGTSIGPKSNISKATSDGRSERVIRLVEHKVVMSFPNVPRNGSGDSGFGQIAATSKK
jgi:hypothetical protein